MRREVVYPLSTVRTLALHTQGLTPILEESRTACVDMQALYETVERLGCVQIDTLQMVQRSHYLAMWSRLGSYDPADLDRLVYDPEHRRLFEGWQHAASIVPLTEYRHQMPRQRRVRESPGAWMRNWLSDPENAALLEHVLQRVQHEGALRAADFKYEGPRRGSWWDWKPAKMALEAQYDYGNLMIAGRINFQRIYDLTERVLPDWVEGDEPSINQRDRHWLEEAARALGACTLLQVSDYTMIKRGPARSTLQSLLDDGVLVSIKAKLVDGNVYELVVQRDNLDLLERIADGAIRAERTTFLSPFDNLFWAAGRDELLWGFDQRLEAYKPAQQRIWGYFCLPILNGERLVGRFDPKLERAAGVLRLKGLYLEPGIEPDEALVAAIAGAMRSFLDFHQARDLVIEHSQPPEFGEKLLAAM
jgi:uncharacterized protein